MTAHAATLGSFGSPHRKTQSSAVSTPVLAVLVFIASEIMYFTALVSALMVVRASSPAWAPPAGVLLPVTNTAFNTAILVLSGMFFVFSYRRFGEARDWNRAKSPALLALALGSFFVVFQGMEWTRLLAVGMTMQSGIFAATFFLIIGSHALHAVGALIAMMWALWQAATGRATTAGYQAMMIFWVFVVAIWPLLYRVVYFN